jgi:hypothetical protein
MPLCGFNKKMLKGETLQNNGLIENLLNKQQQVKQMALCGFNKKMLTGNTMFDEGLVEHGLQHRSKVNGETIDQAIQREISDMTRLLIELPRIEDGTKRLLTEGMVKKAMGFYLTLRGQDIDTYKEVVKAVNKYWFKMDETYYGKLEGQVDDMKQLAMYLNSVKIV